MSRPGTILVLGAGIQGLCTALALRHYGYRVTIIDRMPDLMLRTSLRNEGKIHLGFVYAHDTSFKTAALLFRAACEFAPRLNEWLGTPIHWRSLCSTPFVYLVMRDSMLAPDAIHAHYDRLQAYRNELAASGEPVTYFDQDLRARPLWRPAKPDKYDWYSRDLVADCVETVECALDRDALRRLVKTRLSRWPEIQTRYGHQVTHIERTAHGFVVGGITDRGDSWTKSAEIVINCLWDGRPALDQQLGIAPSRASVMRLKYRLLGELPPTLADLPSMTLVLGRYGDFVRYPHAPSYFSWYPACLRGWSADTTPPREWDAVCAGNPPQEIAEQVKQETLTAFDRIVTGLGKTKIHTIDGGVIYARGETDIDDPASQLHTRHEIGFAYHADYYTVDTGKFTCAPMFAEQVVQHLQATHG